MKNTLYCLRDCYYPKKKTLSLCAFKSVYPTFVLNYGPFYSETERASIFKINDVLRHNFSKIINLKLFYTCIKKIPPFMYIYKY